MNCLISQYFLYVFYIVMQNGNLYHVIPTKVGI